MRDVSQVASLPFGYGPLVERLARETQAYYGDRLIALVLFGSVGRGTPHPGSDLDVLVVATDLPAGRVARVEEFQPIESSIVRAAGADTPHLPRVRVSPLFKTPDEVALGSPLFFDMIDDAVILFDHDGYFRATLERVAARLQALGARRIWRGNAWIWDLNPNYRPGEVFEL